MRHSSTSSNQQRRPLPSLLYFLFILLLCLNIMYSSVFYSFVYKETTISPSIYLSKVLFLMLYHVLSFLNVFFLHSFFLLLLNLLSFYSLFCSSFNPIFYSLVLCFFLSFFLSAFLLNFYFQFLSVTLYFFAYSFFLLFKFIFLFCLYFLPFLLKWER